MKTSKQLLIVLLANLVISIYLFFVLYYMLAVKRKTRFTETLSQFFDLVAASAAIMLPVLFIKMHPKLQDVVRSHLLLSRVSNSKCVAPAGNEEANVYFNELAKSWSVKEKPCIVVR
ncbi:hypothetical protein L596_028895 [Steinernema carpocapsae]|uniref:Uncharacterized protein n=1 Tax=Steinernema carpocapsae TaxID=34508 RepID=A0A4U5LZR0_STECR|nr:hypothetical protein L596_028895 [Steinernema carpocapsae]